MTNYLDSYKQDKKILGVCAWAADKLNIDPVWVRVGFVLATILGFGSPIFIYLVIGLILNL